MTFANLSGKTALVTGGSGGIGAAIAATLKEAGASIIITGSRRGPLEEVAARLDAKFIVADLSTQEEVHALAAQALDFASDGVDILVNNAGFSEDGLFVRQTDAALEKVMQINFTSGVTLAKLLLPKMMKKRHGRIINITSVVAHMGNSGQTAYVASKAALTGFTKALAKEVARRGITVNAVAPGFIDTSMTKTLPEAVVQGYKENIPLGRFGTAADVANSVRFLAADESSYITGSVVHVNGGLYLQ